MFRYSGDLTPKTFSVKSYRIRKRFNFKKFFVYLTCTILLIAALGITFLSMSHVI